MPVIMLNLLISLFGDSFDLAKAQENKVFFYFIFKISFINEIN